MLGLNLLKKKKDINSLLDFTKIGSDNKFIFEEHIDYPISFISSESLDPNTKSNETLFSLYKSVSYLGDENLFKEHDLSLDYLVLKPKLLGREFSKTSSISLKKSALIQIVSGEGYVLLEKVEDKRILNIVKVKSNSYVYVPKGFSFAFINSSEDNDLCVLILRDLNSNYSFNSFEREGGFCLFYIKSGFIKNMNAQPDYKINDFEGNYAENLKFNENISLYDEFKRLPKEFHFLKD